MVVFRYLFKEVVTALHALIGVILLIFISHQLMWYLTRIAGGKFPGDILLTLFMIGIPLLLGLLLPLGFYIAMILAYSRLYAENEMTSFLVCGYSEGRLLKHSLMMAFVIACLTGMLTLWLGPILHTARVTILHDKGVDTLVKTLSPRRFRQFSYGKYVMYMDSIDSERDDAKSLFLAEKEKKGAGFKILTARQGTIHTDKKNNQTDISLKDGHMFQGKPGQDGFSTYHFDTLDMMLTKSSRDFSHDMSTVSSDKLWPLNNKDRKKAAELNWRISVPIMVFILTLFAIPLSKVKPRAGKFSGLIPAILVYTVYANFLFVGRDWLKEGVVPTWAGLWWLHITFFILGMSLLLVSRKRH